MMNAIVDLDATVHVALVSTFELLLKPQLPTDVTNSFPQLEPLSRVILQGYFLTISNVSDRDLSLIVSFKTRSPGLNNNEIVCFRDDDGTDTVLPPTLIPDGPGRSTQFSFTLDEKDTTLILLQPNITDPSLLGSQNYEARGYVEIFAQPGTGSRNREVLISPEHRGTFFDPSNINPAPINPMSTSKASLGELAYPVQLATGSAVVKLDTPD